MTPTEARERLCSILTEDDPTEGLWELCDSGDAELVVPELPALRLEQDPIHRHKDVLAHTIAVTAKTRPDLKVRLAALFHDIGKPATRSFEHGGVTFRHHEAVGAKIARRRLRELEFDKQMVKDVAELVRLSGRFKGYGDGWSDAAVRRYAREAGHLLGDLNELMLMGAIAGAEMAMLDVGVKVTPGSGVAAASNYWRSNDPIPKKKVSKEEQFYEAHSTGSVQ